MYNKKARKIYIIGIGGKGLNSIAQFCHSKGFEVSGSDIRISPETSSLECIGIPIRYEQLADNITSHIDTVVYSSIIPDTHPELVRARELGIQALERAVFLGQLTKDYVRISVAGSHGKSTTSALATLALRSQTGAVNAITGAYIKELESYQSTGDSRYCVLEACEYSKSFMHIPGDCTIITSLEKSHMEYFKNEENMNHAFVDFIEAHAPGSLLIIHGDNPVLRQISSYHAGTVVTCGFNSSNDYVVRDVCLDTSGSTFSLYRGNTLVYENIYIKIPGMYNILNVAYVLVLLHTLGHGIEEFRTVLHTFNGVGRRFEIIEHNDTVFVDDFAHHPSQVKNFLIGLKQFFPHKQIYAVFEPRQYHLIKTFLKEYGQAFQLADRVYITDLVRALGDTLEDIESVSADDIVTSVKQYSKPQEVAYISSYEEAVSRLKAIDLHNTVVATIGAGGVFKVRDLLINGVQY